MNEYENIISDTAKRLGSLSISSIAAKINEKKSLGDKIYNFTIGDFSPEYFPIPVKLEDEIVNAYRNKLTNYPIVGGMPDLLDAISSHIKHFGSFEYNTNEIIAGSGSRVLTYLLFRTLLNKGDKVINVVPSWNNYNFIWLADAKEISVKAKPENNFLITADQLKPHIKNASLIALNSPLNPAGTIFSEEQLWEVFNLVKNENQRRKLIKQKPLFIFFDIVYWLLTFKNTKFVNPVSICPEAREYTVFVDGISKCFAATGVRLGWAFGPEPIIRKMKQIIAHIGAWSPKPEQVATGRFLMNTSAVDEFFDDFKNELFTRLNTFYEGIMKIKDSGYDVDAIYPQGALYLTVKLNLIGKKTADGKVLNSIDDVLGYILEEGKIALVPFYAFGADKDSPWFRLSVGTCSKEEAKEAVKILKETIEKLK